MLKLYYVSSFLVRPSMDLAGLKKWNITRKTKISTNTYLNIFGQEN